LLTVGAAPSDKKNDGVVQTFDEMSMKLNMSFDKQKQELVNKVFSQMKNELKTENVVRLKAKQVQSKLLILCNNIFVQHTRNLKKSNVVTFFSSARS
jgi:hypothetical protein